MYWAAGMREAPAFATYIGYPRIAPVLTPLAASGLVTVMALAAVLHLVRGELGELAMVIVLGALAYFVAWGRFKRAPIARRERDGVIRLHLEEGRPS